MQAKVTAVRGREFYRRYHQLMDDLAQSAGPGTDWRAELRAHVDNFEADATALDAASTRLLREELCAQLEHEALHNTRPLPREILLAAVKWLELSS